MPGGRRLAVAAGEFQERVECHVLAPSDELEQVRRPRPDPRGAGPRRHDFFGTSATSRIDVDSVSSWKCGRR